MNVYNFAYSLLRSGDISSKLHMPKNLTYESNYISNQKLRFIKPFRCDKTQFSKKQLKFPKRGRLKTNEGKRLAVHFFANHELLAIEMMAQAILLFDIDEKEMKRLISTISDEQKHFKLYQELMSDMGCEFGDYPVNDFFWRQMVNVSNFDEFYSVVAMTFEQANLDFANYYHQLFKEIGDEKISNVMKVILDDEISHVARGRRYLEKQLDDDEDLWKYYSDILPGHLTPARAKGIQFDYDARRKSGLSEGFIQNLAEYQDDFQITKRKT